MEYLEKLKDPRWQKKRLEIFERDEWKCKQCYSHNKTLHVHHLFYFKNKEPWEINNGFLITLCEDCHEKKSCAKLLGYNNCSECPDFLKDCEGEDSGPILIEEVGMLLHHIWLAGYGISEDLYGIGEAIFNCKRPRGMPLEFHLTAKPWEPKK